MKLELDQVTLQYGEKAPLLDGASVTWESGAFVVLRGPSGCGKSSLLRLLNRLHEPTAGRLLLDGQPYDCYEPTALRPPARLLAADASYDRRHRPRQPAARLHGPPG